jgi:predicted RNase H-like HicB family nuclease
MENTIHQLEIEEARRYPIVVRWSDEDQVFIASAPDLEGAITHGATIAEAAEKALDVVVDWIYGNRQVGNPIPSPSSIPAVAD